MRTITLKIPGKLPSNNKLSGHVWARTNWCKKFMKELVPLTKLRRWKGRARVCVSRNMGPKERAYDVDNLYGGCKPLLDALKNMYYIEDDSNALLDLSMSQGRADDGPSITITISETE